MTEKSLMQLLFIDPLGILSGRRLQQLKHILRLSLNTHRNHRLHLGV